MKQPRLVEYDGFMFEPTAPILFKKKDDIEIWLTAKEAARKQQTMRKLNNNATSVRRRS